MTRISRLLLASAAGLSATAATPAFALTFNLIDTGGTGAGSLARKDFDIAANYWSSVLTSTATVNLEIGFQSFGTAGANILGQTGSSSTLMSMTQYQAALQGTKSNSQVDMLATSHLPTIDANGGIGMIKPGYVDPASKIGIDTTQRIYDHDDTVDNKLMYTTSANAKAIGIAPTAGNTYFVDPGVDGAITFNSDFNFDFDPRNGTQSGQINFLVVAIHEIGHALGFVSGVDGYDYFGGPSGPCFSTANLAACGIAGQTYDANNDFWGSALDMFRYSSNPAGLNGGGAQLDWSILNPSDPLYTPSTNPYFSIDGGATNLFGNYESRGQYNGASYQASHWRRVGSSNGPGNPTQPFLGIMDPVGYPDNYVTALDIAAFDAIGWNTSFDALADPGYAATTASIYLQLGGVPEPSSWALMLSGFGAIGAGMRRRRSISVAFG